MTPGEVRWPAERFYWSLLEAPQWKRSGELPPGLRALMEEDLPVPADSLQAVAVPLGDGRVLACAMDTAALEALEEGTLALMPESMPEFVPEPLNPASLNLLVGQHEPRPLRRARLGVRLTSSAAVLIACALISVGLLRRSEHWDRAAEQARTETVGAVERVLPGGTMDLLAIEVLRTRRLAGAAATLKPAPDAALSLQSLLRAWPAAVSSKPQSLAVSEAGATVSVSVEGDATPFLNAMKAPPGWTLDEPRLNAAETLTRLTLQLRPSVPERSP